MRAGRTATFIVTGTLVLAACGGGSDDAAGTVETTPTETAVMTTAPSTTEAPTTTADLATTTAAPTTQPDPAADAIAAFAEVFASGDPAGLAFLAPGSPAYVYYEAIVLLSETNPGVTKVTVDGETVRVDEGPTLSAFVFDAGGLITDFNRDDVPLSTSVAASGVVFEGIDEGAGIVGTVHSFRYFDGDLQVVVTTANNSQVEGELSFSEYVSEGREYVNVFSNSTRPSVTSTVMNVFEDVPPSGGTLYGYIWADGIGVLEPTLDVPPLG